MFRNPDRRFRRSSVGFSLVEMLVSTALFSLVLASMYLLYTTMLGTMSRGEMFSDLQQNARVGLHRMVQEVRMAGYDPSSAIPLLTPAPKDFIRAATAGCLSFIGYQVNASADLTYQISYYLEGTPSTLKRLAEPWDSSQAKFGASGGAQPLAENIAALTFTYYDLDNREIVPGAWTASHQCPLPLLSAVPPSATLTQLTYLQLAQVRRIGIRIRTRDTRPRTAFEFYTLNTYVQLRNR
jgi:prepilin-type N-terminal cleavage/methylation domain-containing protein